MLDDLDTTPAIDDAREGRGGHARRTRVLVVRWVAAAAAFIVLIAIAGLPVYVFPHTDRPAKADAVVILGPSSKARVAAATRLVDDGYAPHVYISMPPGSGDTAACALPDVSCFDPKPAKTRGEALFTLDAARAHGWSKVIVVTGVSHVSRARFIFDRCSGVEPLMIGVHEKRTLVSWIYQYSYQTAGFAKALIVGCA